MRGAGGSAPCRVWAEPSVPTRAAARPKRHKHSSTAGASCAPTRHQLYVGRDHDPIAGAACRAPRLPLWGSCRRRRLRGFPRGPQAAPLPSPLGKVAAAGSRMRLPGVRRGRHGSPDQRERGASPRKAHPHAQKTKIIKAKPQKSSLALILALTPLPAAPHRASPAGGNTFAPHRCRA